MKRSSSQVNEFVSNLFKKKKHSSSCANPNLISKQDPKLNHKSINQDQLQRIFDKNTKKKSSNDTSINALEVEKNMNILNEILNSSSTSTCNDDSSSIKDVKQSNTTNVSTKEDTIKQDKIGKYLGIDCEMVGVGHQGCISALARVSIVNYHGHVVLDAFVKPKESITDYRTRFSGITSQSLENAEDFETIQKQVYDIIKGKILIGHHISNDLNALMLDHPRTLIRDTSTYHEFKKFAKGKRPALRTLAKQILGVDIQGNANGHCSVEDARTVVSIYKTVREEWEKQFHPKKLCTKRMG